jgi:ComF family protein
MFFAALKNTARLGLNAVLPPLCLACGEQNSTAHAFCPDCWKTLHFIAPPFCACCGVPFEFASPLPDQSLCGECLRETPAFTAARAALSYTSESRALILPFKNRDRTDYAPTFARLMAQAGSALLEKSDVIVPVPLHPLRLFTRRYNQAALLAMSLGKMSGKPVRLQALVKKKITPSQGRLHRGERQRNVAGAFAVNIREIAALTGHSVLLVDDVLTTGATSNACARVLLKTGAKEVHVLALARVKKAA